MTYTSQTEVPDLCDLSCSVAANIVGRHYRRLGDVHIFANGLRSMLTISANDGNPLVTSTNRNGVKVSSNLIDAVEKALSEDNTVGFCVVSDEAMTHLEKTGDLTKLNGKPIYVREDRYWDVF